MINFKALFCIYRFCFYICYSLIKNSKAMNTYLLIVSTSFILGTLFYSANEIAERPFQIERSTLRFYLALDQFKDRFTRYTKFMFEVYGIITTLVYFAWSGFVVENYYLVLAFFPGVILLAAFFTGLWNKLLMNTPNTFGKIVLFIPLYSFLILTSIKTLWQRLRTKN